MPRDDLSDSRLKNLEPEKERQENTHSTSVPLQVADTHIDYQYRHKSSATHYSKARKPRTATQAESSVISETAKAWSANASTESSTGRRGNMLAGRLLLNHSEAAALYALP